MCSSPIVPQDDCGRLAAAIIMATPLDRVLLQWNQPCGRLGLPHHAPCGRSPKAYLSSLFRRMILRPMARAEFRDQFGDQTSPSRSYCGEL
jgi:hypothetical protein